jgi:hypothetical protein
MIGTIDRDQWSVTARYDSLRPLFLVSLGDGNGTELYVSARTGELALDTNRRERVWNWLCSIPHWIYPTVLRQDGATWRQVVLWISGICLVVAVTGFWIGILRLRLRRRYARGTVTPYRGWMAWHHIAGLIGGIFLLTWMFSGWLSLNPGEYFAARGPTRDMAVRYAGHDTPQISATLPSMPPPGAVEARFAWLGGRPLMALTDRDGREITTDPASGAVTTLSDDEIFKAARGLLPNAEMTLRLRLSQFDDYWYAHHNERPLPVLRAGFDDAAGSWFHIDPRNGDILGRIDSSRRTYRWLFNALHSLDFSLLLRHRPAWDLVILLLSLVGMIVSTSGIVIGWRRLRRHLLPKLLAHGRTHAATEPVPEGWVPCAHVYPPHPLRDQLGRQRPFRRDYHDAFQTMLARYGEKERLALKRQVVESAMAGRGPSALGLPNDRFARATVRVALRQLRALEWSSPAFAEWLADYDASASVDDEDPMEAEH